MTEARRELFGPQKKGEKRLARGILAGSGDHCQNCPIKILDEADMQAKRFCCPRRYQDIKAVRAPNAALNQTLQIEALCPKMGVGEINYSIESNLCGVFCSLQKNRERRAQTRVPGRKLDANGQTSNVDRLIPHSVCRPLSIL